MSSNTQIRVFFLKEQDNNNNIKIFANLEVATNGGHGEGGAAASLNRTTCQPSPTRPCTFGTTMQEFQDGLDKRRKALETAIEIFRHKVSRTTLSAHITHKIQDDIWH